MNQAFPESAMILAAGMGTRLGSVTAHTHKCMVKVGGKPAMQHALERLRDAGVKRIVVNVCHLAAQIMDYFGDGAAWGVQIEYSVEPHPLGTAGGVRNVASFFRNAPFVVWYGDNIAALRLDRMWESHCSSGAFVTIALFERPDVSQSGVAVLDPNGRITRFVEKPKQNEISSHWVNAGVYIANPEIMAAIDRAGGADFGQNVFPYLLESGRPLFGYRFGAEETLKWIDTPADYAMAAD